MKAVVPNEFSKGEASTLGKSMSEEHFREGKCDTASEPKEPLREASPLARSNTPSVESLGGDDPPSMMMQDSVDVPPLRPRRLSLSSLAIMDASGKSETMRMICREAREATPKSAEVVTGGLRDVGKPVREEAVAAAASIMASGPSDARESMLKRMKAFDASIRYDILNALLQLALQGRSQGATAAIEHFQSKDADPSIRMKAISVLQDVAKRGRRLSRDAGVQQEAAQAMEALRRIEKNSTVHCSGSFA